MKKLDCVKETVVIQHHRMVALVVKVMTRLSAQKVRQFIACMVIVIL